MDQPPQDFLLRHLLHAVYWFDDGLQDHLEAAGWPRTSRTKSMILINVADGVTRPIQIAANLGITRQAVHLALEELRKDGLVEMAPDPEDGRAKLVRFAPGKRGDAMRNDALASLQRIESTLKARIGAKRYDALKTIMAADWGESVSPD